jgi:hypothetical protein
MRSMAPSWAVAHEPATGAIALWWLLWPALLPLTKAADPPPSREEQARLEKQATELDGRALKDYYAGRYAEAARLAEGGGLRSQWRRALTVTAPTGSV